ncbi:MAG: hypothetical protein Kilf2KO_22910 [Rhodospirillales bacterium]
MAPTVSVIVPAFRAQATIVRAIRSLLAQTVSSWEALIVSDDGVDYGALLSAAGIEDRRLRHLSSGAIGSGAQATRNAGLARAVGAFVAPLDADDLYYPRRLERLLPLAQSAGAAFDGLAVIDEADGRHLQSYLTDPPDRTLSAEDYLRLPVPMMALARRDWVAGWDPAIDLCDDLAFNLRLYTRQPEVPLAAEALREYRVRDGSICHSPDSAARAEAGYSALLARLDLDGYGLEAPGLIALARTRIAEKRDLNRAFRAAFEAGAVDTFEGFLATRRPAG